MPSLNTLSTHKNIPDTLIQFTNTISPSLFCLFVFSNETCLVVFVLLPAVITDIHYQLSYFQLVDNDLRIIFIYAEQPSSLRIPGCFSDSESFFFVFFSFLSSIFFSQVRNQSSQSRECLSSRTPTHEGSFSSSLCCWLQTK